MLAALFDDHFESFPLWREAGLSGLTCVHVDAHLDVSADGFSEAALEGIARACSRAELMAFRGNPKLPWGGFHCGNYLYPALLDGTVTTLIWVVPRELGEGDSFLPNVRQTMQGWVDMTLPEYTGMRSVGGRVEGTLLGRDFVVCTCDSMPIFSPEQASNVALDIDVDYFIRLKDDQMWQSPQELRHALGDLQPVALTVATSCEGGYTPPEYRYLGQVCLEVFAGNPDAWQAEVQAFEHARRALLSSSTADNSEAEVEAQSSGPGALEVFLKGAPGFMKPAVLVCLGRCHQAEVLDPRYRVSPLDTAGRHFQKKDFSKGLECLVGVTESQQARSYLTAMLAAGCSQFDATLGEVTALLAQPGITPREEARLLAMQAELAGRQGQSKKAATLLKRSLKVEPDRAATHHQLAVHLRRLGERDDAARHLRKALRLSKNRVSSLPILLEASRLYDELGQRALACATRRELEERDVTGFYAITSILDTSR